MHAEADARDADVAEQAGFFRADGGGVCFERPLAECGKVEPIAKAAEQVFELIGEQRSRSATAEVNGFRLERVVRNGVVHFAQQGIEKCAVFIFSADFDVEAAIRAQLRAKGDVEVEMTNDGFRLTKRARLFVRHSSPRVFRC